MVRRPSAVLPFLFVALTACGPAATGGGGTIATGPFPGTGAARYAVPLVGEGGIVVGDRVMLARHQLLGPGDPNWADGDMDAYVGRIGTVQSFSGRDPQGFMCARLDIDANRFCWRSAALIKLRPVAAGDSVLLTRHDVFNGDANWVPEMDQYVGRIARVTTYIGPDQQGAPVVNVDIDSGHWAWRVRNLVKLDVVGSEPAAGSWVVLTHHNPVNGDENWTPEMARFVLATTRVTQPGGADPTGEQGVRVEADGGQFFWRSRSLIQIQGGAAPVGGIVGGVVTPPVPGAVSSPRWMSALADEASTRPGDRILLGRHDVLGAGDPNWTPEMEPFVGRIATVSYFSGRDAQGFLCARIDLDSARFCWRLRAMIRLAPAMNAGDAVILTRHDVVGGGDNWTPEMDAFVGMIAHISSFTGADPNGQQVARVDVDNGQYAWRLRNLVRITPAPPGEPTVGTFVVLTRHERVAGGDDNWTPEMAPFVMRMTRVTTNSGADPAGEQGVRVEADAGQYFWRSTSVVQIRAGGGSI